MPDEKLRFAMLGAGNVAQKYVAAIGNLPEAELVGVVTPIAEEVSAFAAKHEVPHHALTLAALLAKADCDAVIVATPSGLHAENTIDAAGLGKHVLCEKPLDITVAKIDAAIEACRRADVRLGCTYQHRTAEHNQAVRQAIQSGKLGQVYIANAFLKNFRDQGYYDSSGGWRGTWAMDGGGPFMQQAAHTVDLMVWILGRAREVYAVTRTAAHDIETEDMGHALITYDGGARGVIEASTVVRPGYPTRMEFHGERGSILLSEEDILAWDVDGVPAPAIASAAGASGSADPMAIGTQGHERVLSDFVQAVRDGREPTIDAASARLGIELTQAIYTSAREGRPVKLD